MAASECLNAIASRLIINIQLIKNKTATIVSVDDVTKSHFSCSLTRIIRFMAFYELDTLTWNKGLILVLIH